MNNTVVNYTIVNVHSFHGPFTLSWMLLVNIGGVLLLVPILDRIVYPMWFPWLPNMFNRIGIGLFTSLLGVVVALIIEAVRYHVSLTSSKQEINSFLNRNVQIVDFSVWVLAPQFLLQALAECFVFITSKFSNEMYVTFVIYFKVLRNYRLNIGNYIFQT